MIGPPGRRQCNHAEAGGWGFVTPLNGRCVIETAPRAQAPRGAARHARARRPLRTALATCLALVMIPLATSGSGADPPDQRPGTVQTSTADGDPTPTAAKSPSHKPESTGPAAGNSTADQHQPTLENARAEASAATAALADAQAALEQAETSQAKALAKAATAQQEFMSARVRLGDHIAAADAALAELDLAVARVTTARAGSKARRSAFTAWQLAAVSQRAAHARRTVAEDVGLQAFRTLQAAESALANAEIALADVRTAHRRAARQATEASAGLAELEAETSPGAALLSPAEQAKVRP